MRLFVSFILVFIVSCSGNDSEINNADKIEIFIPYKGRVLHYIDTSERAISFFKKVLDGKSEKRKCAASGEIRFLSKGSIVLEAGFSISEANCQYLMKGEKAWKLTYHAGMYLSETFSELTKDK